MKKIVLLFFVLLNVVVYSQAKSPVLSKNQKDSVNAMIDEKITNFVDKTTVQTITGQKNFTANKTVFGTTTNDSVGIRGRINVGRKITVGAGNNLLSFDNATLLSGGALPEFNLKLNDPMLSPYQMSLKFDYLGLLTLVGTGIYTGLPAGNLSYNGGTVNSSDVNWLLERDYAIYSMNGLRTDGDIHVDSGDIYVNGDINVIGNYYRNGVPITASGSVGDADSLGSLPASAYVTKTAIDEWSTNLYTGSANVMRLGKSYNDKRFNNGAYSDVWNIDYVIPPYNLSADWLYPIEHRVDYFNDTLQTTSGVANLFYIDGSGTLPRWKTSNIEIGGVSNYTYLGDLPDSTTLGAGSYAFGQRTIIAESNMTASTPRFPMPLKGYEIKFGTNNYYTFPTYYGFYSDLTTNTPSLETAYHFYGQGDYPSYFGGNILTDGIILVGNDTVLTTGDGESIVGTINTLDSLIIAFWNGTLAGGLTESQVNALIEANEDTSGSAIIGTTATLDSIIIAFWNGTLGSGSTWDSTYAYQRITALESTVNSLQNSINNILAALDTCGCSASTADNTPPLAPTSYVAVGGTSQTQYVTTWTDPVASDLDSIRWYEGSSADTSAMTWITSIAGGTETYTRTGRTANTTYWSAIKAVDDSGNVSYFSNVDSATTLPTGGVTPVVTLDFEEGNLSEWSSTSGANLSASTTFAYNGTYSMRVGTNSYGVFNFTSDTEVWLTFWIYLPSTSSQNASYNYISMFDNGIADRSCFGTNNSTWSEWIVGTTSGNMTDNDYTTNFSQNTWHKVKVYYQTNGSTTSNHQVWVDDTSIWNTTGAFINSVSLFTIGSEAATITNWFYIDDIKLYTSDPGTQD